MHLPATNNTYNTTVMLNECYRAFYVRTREIAVLARHTPTSEETFWMIVVMFFWGFLLVVLLASIDSGIRFILMHLKALSLPSDATASQTSNNYSNKTYNEEDLRYTYNENTVE